MKRFAPIAMFAMALSICALQMTSAHAASLGESSVLAPVPAAPGYPEGIATRGNKVYVAGPAAFGQPLGSAAVLAYDIDEGTLEETIPITVTNPYAGMSAASCIAFGPDGKLYVVEPFVGIVRLSLSAKHEQSVYAPFTPNGPSLLNDLAFGPDGALYVTDSFQATVFRVPPGGGEPEVWFTDPRLAGDPNLPFGVNGIRLDKTGTFAYLTVTAEVGSLEGVIYRLPLTASPQAADLEEFYRYPIGTMGPQGPDGVAFGKSGRLYVALAGSSEISVLDSSGAEVARYAGPATNVGGDPDPLPWTNPASIAFDDQTRSLLVTNHASLVPYDPSLFAVFDVYVADKAQPLR